MKIEALPDDLIDELISKSTASEFGLSPTVGATYGDMSVSVMPDASDAVELIWCEFCNQSYNEYHFGDIEWPEDTPNIL